MIPVVIFDGDCEFCRQSLMWIGQKVEITPLPFQSAELSKYSLTTEQCAKQVYVIADGTRFSGADAIAYLTKLRGNALVSWCISIWPGLSRKGYFWIAAHRDGLLVAIITKCLQRLNR